MESLKAETQIALFEAAKRGKNELKLILTMYPSMPDGGALAELERVLETAVQELGLENE